MNFEGPGCSSIVAGAFCKHGPFRPSGDISVKNYYSWNKGIPSKTWDFWQKNAFFKVILPNMTCWKLI